MNLTFPVVPYFSWKLEFVSNVLSMIVGAFSSSTSFQPFIYYSALSRH